MTIIGKLPKTRAATAATRKHYRTDSERGVLKACVHSLTKFIGKGYESRKKIKSERKLSDDYQHKLRAASAANPVIWSRKCKRRVRSVQKKIQKPEAMR